MSKKYKKLANCKRYFKKSFKTIVHLKILLKNYFYTGRSQREKQQIIKTLLIKSKRWDIH